MEAPGHVPSVPSPKSGTDAYWKANVSETIGLCLGWKGQ